MGVGTHRQCWNVILAAMRKWMMISGGILASALVVQSVAAQRGIPKDSGADWPMYRRDLIGSGYSPLTQIDTRNVADLARAWTYRLQGDPATASAAGAAPPAVNSQATPIVVAGVMYLAAANRVVALESGDGEGDLAASGHRRRAIAARRGLLTG